MKKFILLSLSLSLAIFTNAQDCSELFISEYIEGPGNNNGIEIYNPTDASVDLSAYSINRYRNGSTSGPDSWPLSGSLAAGAAIAVGNGQVDSLWISTYWSLPVDPVFYDACNLHGSGLYPTPFYFNGDDAMTLEKGTDIVDIFGKVGEDPGDAWTDDASANYTDANGGTWWTKRQTLIRKASVKGGVTINPALFNVTLEWDSLPDATYSEMGMHACDCNIGAVNENQEISYVMYPNPAKVGTAIAVNANEKIELIEVFSTSGAKVLTQQSPVISTQNLAVGSYIIHVTFAEGKQAINKLIIE